MRHQPPPVALAFAAIVLEGTRPTAQVRHHRDRLISSVGHHLALLAAGLAPSTRKAHASSEDEPAAPRTPDDSGSQHQGAREEDVDRSSLPVPTPESSDDHEGEAPGSEDTPG